MRRSAFTLIEMLLAVMLSVLLMAGILIVLGRLSRDVQKPASAPPDGALPVLDLIQWDLSNARTMIQAPDARTLVLIGHGGIDRDSLTPNGRLVRVTYTCPTRGTISCLAREQQFLDDPVQPKKWSELVASGISTVMVIPIGPQPTALDPRMLADDTPDLPASVRAGEITRVPQWVRLRLAGSSISVERQVCVK